MQREKDMKIQQLEEMEEKKTYLNAAYSTFKNPPPEDSVAA